MNNFFCKKCESNLDVSTDNKKKIEVIKQPTDFVKLWNKLNSDILYELEFDEASLTNYLTIKKNKNKIKILEIFNNVMKNKILKTYNFICYNCNSTYPLTETTTLFSINYQSETNVFNEK